MLVIEKVLLNDVIDIVYLRVILIFVVLRGWSHWGRDEATRTSH